MLFVNRENQVVDKLAIFEKLLALWKLIARIEKILCPKVILMSVSSTFGISGKLVMPTFQWHKSCKVLSFDRETTTFGIKGCRSDFLDDILFSSEDSRATRGCS
uniref:Uncharacterized protein n=1 Tax=Fagus sylvatica TaxID=28930 RepID=A0A2N9I438_FAGSY